MPVTSYEQLRQLTTSGRLEIYHIVAPPRSGSTALERALSNSPDINSQINDPWSIYDSKRESQTYRYILNRVQNSDAPAKNNPLRVIIKDIADYIPPGDAWRRMTEITKHTVFLIREPLLAMESMMRIMANEVPVNRGNAYAKEQGYTSWAAMRESVKQTRDYRPYDALYQWLFRTEQPIHSKPEMQLPVIAATGPSVIRRLGFNSADSYAASKGYASWQALIQDITTHADKLAICQDLLEVNFACRITGWAALSQHIDAMQRKDNFTVVDATMFRAAPEAITQIILQRANLTFTPAVVDWSQSKKVFTPDYEGDTPYYDKVVQSAGVAPPSETVIPINQFPTFIQESLTGEDGALALYRRYLKQAVATLPPHITRHVMTATFDGVPLSTIDPIFHKELLALQP